MADLSALKSAAADLQSAVSDVKVVVDDLRGQTSGDSSQQAEVDSVTSQVQGSIQALRDVKSPAPSGPTLTPTVGTVSLPPSGQDPEGTRPPAPVEPAPTSVPSDASASPAAPPAASTPADVTAPSEPAPEAPAAEDKPPAA